MIVFLYSLQSNCVLLRKYFQMDTLSFAVQQEIDPKSHFLSYLKNGIRPNGRVTTDYRHISIRTGSSSAPNVYGSSQVQMGETIVTCGVNLMVGSPSLEEPQLGDIGETIDLIRTSHDVNRFYSV